MRKTILTALFLLRSTDDYAATTQQNYDAGVQFYNQKQYNQAINYLKAAVQIDSSNWQAYQLMGNCYYSEGDKTDALTAYDQSLGLHADNQVQAFADQLRATAAPTPLLPSSQAKATGPAPEGPVVGGGNFGIGLEAGDPASFGASGKYWLDQQSAFQAGSKSERRHSFSIRLSLA